MGRWAALLLAGASVLTPWAFAPNAGAQISAPQSNSHPTEIDREIERLSSPYAGERDAAVDRLGKLLQTPAPLLKCLQSTSARTRKGSARALSKHFEGRQVIGALLKAWQSEQDAYVRKTMAFAIME